MNNAADSSTKDIAITCNALAGSKRPVTLAERISSELSQNKYFILPRGKLVK